MILVQCYVGQWPADEFTRLFDESDSDYAQQYAEVMTDRSNVDSVFVQTVEAG